jgi:hypothetical protein
MYHETSERFTHSIFVIAVAQLPPPHCKFYIFGHFFIKFKKVLKIGLIKQKTVEDAISHRAMKTGYY